MSKSIIERIKRKSASSQVGEKQEIATVQLRRPDKQEWIRVHPELSFPVTLVEDRKRGVMYVADEEMIEYLVSNEVPFSDVDLVLAVTVTGGAFFFPVREGDNEWSKSMKRIVKLAKESWVRVIANRDNGEYSFRIASGNLPEPMWPEKTPEELLEMALEGKLIDSPDHDLVKRLRGAF